MTTNAERVKQAIAEFAKLVEAALENGQDVSGEIKAGHYVAQNHNRVLDASAVLLVVIGPLPPEKHQDVR